MFFFDALFVLTAVMAGWLCFLLLAVGMFRIMQALYAYFEWKDRHNCLSAEMINDANNEKKEGSHDNEDNKSESEQGRRWGACGSDATCAGGAGGKD